MPLSFILPLLPTYVRNNAYGKAGELCSRVMINIDGFFYSREQLTEQLINSVYVTRIDAYAAHSWYPTRGHLTIFCERRSC